MTCALRALQAADEPPTLLRTEVYPSKEYNGSRTKVVLGDTKHFFNVAACDGEMLNFTADHGNGASGLVLARVLATDATQCDELERLYSAEMAAVRRDEHCPCFDEERLLSRLRARLPPHRMRATCTSASLTNELCGGARA